MLRLVVVLIVLLGALAVGGYLYWTNSPLYAFQEAALAVKNHDETGLKRRVVIDNVIDHLLEDLVVQPALSTPHLSGFQSQVLAGALAMAKKSMTDGLLDSIHKSVATTPQSAILLTQTCLSPLQYFGLTPALAAPGERRRMLAQVDTGAGKLKQLLNAAGREMANETKKLRTTAFNRMQTYIHNHPSTVPGRLLDCPPEERGRHARIMLEEYGLTVKNFKGLACCSTTSDIIGRESGKVGFNFYSPKIGNQIEIDFEMIKDLESKEWRINSLSNIAQVMEQLEPAYQTDIHELVEYSLSGMSNKNMETDMHGMTERLKQDPTTQNLLNNIKLRF
ncbi:MAG: hypothetical protein KGS72_25570 [Cyanobacteria bacterium REEB67]|nr:hypothetical protein [Cyanobacteria bacterium REEB67]